MATAAATLLLLVVIACLQKEASSNRPSYAGISGGTLSNYVGQIIPLGTPWPAKAEDYSTTPKPTLEDKLYTISSTETATSGTTGPVNVTDSSRTTTEAHIENSSKVPSSSQPPIVLEYQPDRPSFAGSTGGTWESYVGQRVPPGTPWPEKVDKSTSLPPKQGDGFSSSGTTIQEEQSYTTVRYQNTTIEAVLNQTNKDDSGVQPSTVLEYKPNRPSFAGSIGGTWEGYLVQKNPNGTAIEKPTNVIFNSNSSTTSRPSIVLEYQPDRPSFAGSTGGTWESLVGQRVPNGTTTEKQGNDSPISSTTSSPSIDLDYKPNRPSFAGSTGGTWESLVGQRVPNGTTTEKQGNDFPIFTTTSSPSIVLDYKPNRPSFAGSTGGTWESLVGQRVPNSTTTEKQAIISHSSTSNSVILEYKPNRPSFVGSMGGTWESLVGQKVPNGTTTEKQGNDSPIFFTTSSPSIVLDYKPNRPSFAGSTGGTWESLVGQRIPDSSTTTEKQSVVVVNSTSTVLEYQPNRPSFAGSTGGTWESLVGQKVPNGTTTEKRGNDSPIFTTTSSPSIVLDYKPNRPSFAGSTGGTWENLVGQRVPDGSTTTDKETNVLNSTSVTILEYQPNRPSFAGSRGGIWGSLVGQRIPNGTTSEKQVNVSSISDSPAYNASTILEYQPNGPNVDSDINKDIIKATKKFLEAEKCKDNFTIKDNTTDVQVVFNSILNIERDREEK
ncbi:uncharacterized protein LOC108903968 [Anoplophora glabripennis]|uniref:uncharacterized protein LOC108903968 n=1 Tax=Anoplophora glabripennis TaxID=217634 RepID=UPI000873D978|nr:uncharacterized protein LOC108903968 [Anoplophora glabripennis]